MVSLKESSGDDKQETCKAERGQRQMDERREHPRYPVSVPVLGSVVDREGRRRGLNANTLNVSRHGLALAIHGGKETIDLLPSLLPQDHPIELEVELAPFGPRIGAAGSVRWHSTRSLGNGRHYFISGILLDRIAQEENEHWIRFVDHVALKARQAEA